MKKIAGILMLLIGIFGLLFTLLINSGHTSSSTSITDDILGTMFSIVLVIGGIYALRRSNKSYKRIRNINR